MLGAVLWLFALENLVIEPPWGQNRAVDPPPSQKISESEKGVGKYYGYPW